METTINGLQKHLEALQFENKRLTEKLAVEELINASQDRLNKLVSSQRDMAFIRRDEALKANKTTIIQLHNAMVELNRLKSRNFFQRLFNLK